MKVLELKGYKSLRALNAFSALMLGVKMLPAYRDVAYEDFLAIVQKMDPADQRKVITEAVVFVELQREEVEALVCFCTDLNGMPYTEVNMHNLGPDQLVAVVVAVCMEIVKIKIDFISESEKKN